MNLLDFLVLILAGGGLVDVWLNGSIFAEWRSFLQAKLDAPSDEGAAAAEDDDGSESLPTEPLSWPMRLADRFLPLFVAELLTCDFCLSYHVPGWIALSCFVPALFVEEPWSCLFKLPAYVLAATRVGNLLNGLLPERMRYNRNKD